MKTVKNVTEIPKSLKVSVKLLSIISDWTNFSTDQSCPSFNAKNNFQILEKSVNLSEIDNVKYENK